MTTDKNRADALKTIAEFPVTDPANMDALNMRKIAADAIAAPVEQHEAAPALSEQDIYDKFSFLEGLVSESTYVSIAETAIAIYEHGLRVRHEAAPTDAENFACYLIDKCEGEMVTEENVQAWLGAMLRDPQYATTQPAPSAPLEGTGNGADERAANPIGYIRADDLKELADGNGAIISPKCGDTDVPVFARAPRTEVAGAVPEGWMLVPKHRGTKPLAELIIAASLACVENQLMDDDDRHEFAHFADQLQRAPEPPALKSAQATAKQTAAEMMVAARNAQMFQDVRLIVATCADRNARAPYRHIEAQRVLPLLDGFLGEGYTGRVMAFKRALAPQPPSADAAAAPADAEAAFEAACKKAAPYFLRDAFWIIWQEARAAASQPAAAAGQVAVAMPAGWTKLAESARSLRRLYHNTHCNPEGFRLAVESLADDAANLLRSPPPTAPASAPVGLTSEQLRKALSQAWNLGQTYWQQADSEYASQNRKSDGTRDKYLALVEETCAILGAKHE